MYAKMAFRNAKRSARDYLIYLLTLVLSVGLFYGFLSITSPSYNNRLPIQMDLEYFSSKMRIIIPLIALLLVFLISYVNRYMIRRRKKEFALQIILGMEQRTVAYLFFLETLLMGLIAVIFGILLGTLLSQFVSVIIMASFGEPYRLYFSVFSDTVLWTFLFFTALFAVIGLGNVHVIRRQKIIDMLHEEQQTESTVTVKDMLLKSLIAASLSDVGILLLTLCGVLPFWNKLNQAGIEAVVPCILSALLFLVLAGFFLLETCVWKHNGSLTAAILSVASLAAGVFLLRMTDLFTELVREGILMELYTTIPSILGVIMILFSIVSIFSSLSWLLLVAKKNSARFHYTHLFLLGQIVSKLKTASHTMAILTCVLLSSLVLLAWLPILTGEVDGYLTVRSIFDVQIFSQYQTVKRVEDLPKSALDYSYIDNYLKRGGYKVTNSANVEAYFLQKNDFDRRIKKNLPILGVSLSDYNALLRLSGHPEIVLPESGFAVAWGNTALPDDISHFDNTHQSITAGNYTLKKAPDADYQVNVGMGMFTSGMEMAYILPDDVCETLTLATTSYAANTTSPLDYHFALALSKDITQWMNHIGTIPENSGFVRLKTLQLNEGISNSLMLRLGGTYASLILIVICLTILSLQQLMDATEHKQRFQIIENLGIDHKWIGKIIRQQMLLWFGLPVIIAFLGSGIVLTYLSIKNYREYIPYVTISQVYTNIAEVCGAFLLVLICYFTATYTLFRRYIAEL
ncbi:hypothetical protein CAFE_27920 [Caprobacter fermentans]|uniref:ABC transporter permease n=1 Tax=Caproicibacter fermentans TaxID=2576756 RepID=A0A6N8I1S6_9FIRM|nr:ABC transporter permease [Caproicibacter fermentans]MVB12061.1 hypothetical protein [Caproicibacter fermentans]OCN00639.1 hypothetical protein A7X67_05275 [Clostridium sp. W14A]QNK40652.1 ABC transporter permease [Caproicibacter fermentans]